MNVGGTDYPLNPFSDDVKKRDRYAAAAYWLGCFLLIYRVTQGKFFLRREIWDPYFGSLYIIGDMLMGLVFLMCYCGSIMLFVAATIGIFCSFIKSLFVN